MLRRFWNDESGQGMTEYILILALIAVAAIVITRTFGGQIRGLFTTAGERITTEGNQAMGGR